MSFGMLLIVVMLAAAGLLRLTQWLTPPSSIPLLTHAEGLVRLPSLVEVKQYISTPVNEPEQTFGAALHVVGVYTKETPEISAGSVSLVYVRNGFRFVELAIQPGNIAKKILSLYHELPQEKVILSKESAATFVTLREQSSCRKPSEEMIGACQLTRALLFELNGYTYILYADGTHPTNGELIEMARSIKTE